MSVGEILELYADDPAAVVDVPHFCNENGHLLKETKDQDAGKTLYLIEKR